jgi:hypothetical protein
MKSGSQTLAFPSSRVKLPVYTVSGRVAQITRATQATDVGRLSADLEMNDK